MIRLIFILCLIILPNSADSDVISGSELQFKIEEWLNEKNQAANIKILPKLKFNKCKKNLVIQDISLNFKLIKISCNDETQWSYIVRNKNIKKKTRQVKKTKNREEKL